jgi:hypothetical protein
MAHGFYNGQLSGRWSSLTTDAVIYAQQTLLGPDKKPLTVDGIVGGQTWWALESAPADQSLGLSDSVARKVSKQRDDLLIVANKYYGTAEEPLGSNRSKLIDKWTGFKGDDQGPPWCCFFVSAVCNEVLKKYPLGERVGGCVRAVELATKLGLMLERDVMPCPGDQFVMLYELKPGRGHTGFVTGVEVIDGKATRVSTVEGNCGNRVARRIRDVSTIHCWIDVVGKPRDFAPGLADGTAAKSTEPTR